jgi:molybdenum cofactor cytidylyltransferase
MPVHGIVLAAGRSSRMGAPKADLELDGRTFLERCIDLLRQGGCRAVVVVVSDERAGAGVTGGAPSLPGDDVLVTVNPDPASQPIDSLRIGLAALPVDCAAAAVLPVDAPNVQPATVARLLRALREADPGTLILRPVHRGQPGHPTLFTRALFPELATGDLPHGAETVVERHADARLDVAVDDPGVAANVNTPADYRSLQARP